MAGKGRGYHGHSREHGLHRKGISTKAKGIKSSEISKKASGFLDELKWKDFDKSEEINDPKLKAFIDKFKPYLPNNYEIGTGNFHDSAWWNLIYIKDGNTLLVIDVDEKDNRIHVGYIQSNKLGSGLGTKVINNLKEYSENEKKYLNFAIVNNPRFFNKFDWLQRIDPVSYISKWYYEDSVKDGWIREITDEELNAWEEEDIKRYGDCKAIYCGEK